MRIPDITEFLFLFKVVFKEQKRLFSLLVSFSQSNWLARTTFNCCEESWKYLTLHVLSPFQEVSGSKTAWSTFLYVIVSFLCFLQCSLKTSLRLILKLSDHMSFVKLTYSPYLHLSLSYFLFMQTSLQYTPLSISIYKRLLLSLASRGTEARMRRV